MSIVTFLFSFIFIPLLFTYSNYYYFDNHPTQNSPITNFVHLPRLLHVYSLRNRVYARGISYTNSFSMFRVVKVVRDNSTGLRRHMLRWQNQQNPIDIDHNLSARYEVLWIYRMFL